MNQYKSSVATRRAYQQSLCFFFEVIYSVDVQGVRNQDHVAQMDKLSIKYLSEDRDHFSDLIDYSDALSKYAPITSTGHLNRVRYWMEINDIVIKRSKLVFLKHGLPKNKVITKDHALSIDEVRRWHENVSRIGRVIMLIQLSSGMRINEILALLPNDINLNSSPVEVSVTKSRDASGNIKSTKNESPRFTFISSEAAFALQEWYTVRGDWFKIAVKRGRFRKKDPNDSRIFPIGAGTTEEIYLRGLKKTGLYQIDENSLRSTITSHSLRKFFISQLKVAGMPDIIAEGLAGHTGYLGGAYDRVPKEQVQQAYLKAEYAVSLSGGDVKEMHEAKEALNEVRFDNIMLHEKKTGWKRRWRNMGMLLST